MLYTTSLCSSKKRIADAVRELAQLGFRNIELTGKTEFYDTFEKDLFDLKKECQLNFLIHNYFPPQADDFVLNLASKNPDIEEKTLSLIRQAVSLSRKFGKDLYSIHPGFRNNLLPKLKDGFFIKEDERVNSKADFYQMIDIILDKIILDDFKIAVENLCPKTLNNLYSFISAPRDIEEFLSCYYNRTNVGILLDLGHLNISSNCLNFNKIKASNDLFTKYQNRIFEIHISENDGQKDFHKISPIDSWQIEFLSKNKEALKNIPIILEWHHSAKPLAYERFKMIRDKLGY